MSRMKEYMDYLYSPYPADLFMLEGKTKEEFEIRCEEREKILFGDVIKESEEFKSFFEGHEEWLEEMRNKPREQGSSNTAD